MFEKKVGLLFWSSFPEGVELEVEANVHACISIFDDDLPRSTSAASFPRQT